MQRFLNNYETTLQTGIDETANAIQVYPSTTFDDVSALTPGDYYLLTISDGTNIEIVKVTSVSMGPIRILSVDRDVSSSGHGSFAFAAGASVKMSVVAETLSALNEVLINADYPPNYTVNRQTKSTAGTVNVPFTPLVIQQVDIDVATGVVLNVTPGLTWGEATITLYRTMNTHDWPQIKYNGTVVQVSGVPPEDGVYNAKLVCRSEPSVGYLPNPFVTFEWVTVIDPALSVPDASYPPTFSIVQTTRSDDGGTVNITFAPLVIRRLNRTGTGSIFVNVLPSSEYGEMNIFIYRSDSSYSWPVLTYNAAAVPIYGTPPAAPAIMAKVVCRRIPTGGGFPVTDDYVTFDWNS